MSEIRIVAELWADAGQKEKLAPVLKELVAGSRSEAGNISYNLFEDINNPDHLVFIETWKSQEAIDSHNKTPHFQRFLDKTRGMKVAVTLLKEAD